MLEEQNKKVDELSKSLASLHVKNLLKKYQKKKNTRLSRLSAEQKENLRSLFTSLEEQVNSLLEQGKENKVTTTKNSSDKPSSTRAKVVKKIN